MSNTTMFPFHKAIRSYNEGLREALLTSSNGEVIREELHPRFRNLQWMKRQKYKELSSSAPIKVSQVVYDKSTPH